MKSPLVIVLVAVVLVAVSALAVMNNACKTSQHT
jgi:Tfp pilus assembly protein PilV